VLPSLLLYSMCERHIESGEGKARREVEEGGARKSTRSASEGFQAGCVRVRKNSERSEASNARGGAENVILRESSKLHGLYHSFPSFILLSFLPLPPSPCRRPSSPYQSPSPALLPSSPLFFLGMYNNHCPPHTRYHPHVSLITPSPYAVSVCFL